MERRLKDLKRLRAFVSVIALMLLSFSVNAQTITGKVTDESGTGLVGVNIVEKGTNNGTITDMNGSFKITVQSMTGTLVFSMIGYETAEVPIEGKTLVDIQMSVSEEAIDEVVVVGYGTMKKSDLTGSVASVSGDDLKRSITTNIDQAMQGRISGVQVTQNSGQPGGASSIRIRGASSVNGSNEPLYIIDGVQFVGSGTQISGFDWAGGANGQNRVNPLSTINPADIVSIDVQKDASAAAIYGAQAANGVIIITTRKGKKGETKISYNGYTAMQTLPKKLEMMNLREFAEYKNQIADELEQNRSEYYLDPSILGEGTDWQNELFQKAMMQNHQLSVTGGTNTTTYSLSGGYFKQDGIIVGSDFNRFNTKINLDSELKKWLTMGGVLTFAQTKETITLNDGGDGVIMQALLMQPDVAVKNADGTYAGPADQFSAINPVALALEKFNQLKRQRVTGNVYANLSPFTGFSFRSEYSYDLNNANNLAFYPSYKWGIHKNDISQMQLRNDRGNYWIWKNYLTYNLKLADQHDFRVMFGHEMQKSAWSGSSLVKQGFTTNDIKVMTQDGTFVSNNGWEGSQSQMSYFGRLNYGFSDRYLASFTFRADGSSKFGADNKWGYFPSGSIAWRINNEEFLKNVEVVSNLKLRLSYGSVGNMPSDNYLYGASMVTLTTPYGTGYRPARFPNSALKWETTEQTNLGLDLGLFNGRFDLQVDLYKKNTKDLLLQISVPSYLGGSTWQDIQAPTANVGKLENKGIDIALNTVNIRKNNLSWNSTFTFSLNRNKVIELNEKDAKFFRPLYWYSEFQTATLTTIGQPLGVFYGYIMEGVFTSADDIANHAVQIKDPNNPTLNFINEKQGVWLGDVKFKDISGPDGIPDGIIDSYDQTIIGDPNPDFTFGLNNTLIYKNFELTIYLAGSYGADILNYARVETEGLNNVWRNQAKSVVNRAVAVMIDEDGNPSDPYNYQLVNPGTDIPRVTSNDNNRNNRMSSRFIEDGSYLRIQNISLAYTFPRNMISKVGIQNAKIYANIQNAFTFTRYSGYDPEIGAFNQDARMQNIDMGRYPSPRVYTLGINLDF